MKTDWIPVLLFATTGLVVAKECISARRQKKKADEAYAAWLTTHQPENVWSGLSSRQIPNSTERGRLIQYGHDLIANTAQYLGPQGSVAQISNGMNCQNCHLQAGTVPYGNNFGKVYATYPLFRARNNGVQTIYDRVKDCFERSLNGHAPDTGSREMQAIYAYIRWLGEDVPKGTKPKGTGIMKLPYLSRSADPAAGMLVYEQKCSSCHGKEGEGQSSPVGPGYSYPPLWGPHSYNDGAGLYRLSNFAGFVYNNMPLGTTYHRPQLSEEEAWDVAAFVNSRPRPHLNQDNDWKLTAKKPVDFPFKPYADTFSERQHKFGPYQPIKEAQQVTK
ncbi:c-type cytochrome [Chitinophaga oryzae]|uniref:C-type cytochrome n=1 Tax=Chitinophaga oryzae TaxID=2725414 RepID=A0ABX6LHY3_9BACT|nr:c-type cytochrome [Chitinophaga oryzae]QJB39535.1 c-type cytochrome [Chitinophaga oryzae]